MSSTDALSEPLAAALGAVLTVPVVELYAALWRIGVVEIVSTRQVPHRSVPQFGGLTTATLLSA
jgi:hypothetical protein